jgi:hypothetical protein
MSDTQNEPTIDDLMNDIEKIIHKNQDSFNIQYTDLNNRLKILEEYHNSNGDKLDKIIDYILYLKENQRQTNKDIDTIDNLLRSIGHDDKSLSKYNDLTLLELLKHSIVVFSSIKKYNVHDLKLVKFLIDKFAHVLNDKIKQDTCVIKKVSDTKFTISFKNHKLNYGGSLTLDNFKLKIKTIIFRAKLMLKYVKKVDM